MDDNIDISKIVITALKLLDKYKDRMGNYTPRNYGAGLIVRSINMIYGGGKASSILRELSRNYNVNESSVWNVLKKLSDLENGGGE